MKSAYVVLGSLLLAPSILILLYSLNGLSQFDGLLGQLTRLSAEGQQEYNEWQMLEIFSVATITGGTITLAYGIAAKAGIRHNDFHPSAGRVF
jgi:hypothetical protein